MKDLLRHRVLRRLLGGWTVGNLADSALFLTLGVWAKDLTGSSSAAGLVFFALALPSLLAPLLGLLTDRVLRKPLLVVANLASAAVVSTLVLVQDAGDLWLLYAVTLAYGALGVLNGSAQSGLLRDLLPDKHLGDANALLSTIDQGLRVFTPAVGAGLYVIWGGPALGLGVAALLVVTALVLLTVHVQESAPERVPGEPFLAETLAGFRHLRRVPVLLRIVVVTAIAFGVVGVFDTALFEVVEKGLGMDAAFFGVLMALQGAGSIVGGITSAALLRRLGPVRAVGLALAVLGVSATSMAADALPIPLLPVVVVAITCAGVSIPWVVVSLITTRQQATPPRLQGRTAAATNIAMTVPQLASIAAGAGLIAVVDYRIVMVAAGLVVLGCAAALLLGRTPAEQEGGEAGPAGDGAFAVADPNPPADREPVADRPPLM